MAFNRKRGRPKATPVSEPKDLGTQELIKKRAYQVTAEAIDLCLEKGLISIEQHWCALHLRWLYTLRYGVPSVKAIDPTHFGGKTVPCDSAEWRREREKEYLDALQAIGSARRVKHILDICIFGYRPAFLQRARSDVKHLQRNFEEKNQHLEDIRAGLEALVKWWCRRKPATVSA